MAQPKNLQAAQIGFWVIFLNERGYESGHAWVSYG